MQTDPDLLFGVVALQAGVVTPEQFAEASSWWLEHRDRSLAEWLVGRGWITPDDRLRIAALVEKVQGAARHATPLVPGATTAGQSSAWGEGLAQSASLETPPPPAAPGVPGPGESRFSRARFRWLHRHARGGLGEVWLARDDDLERDVALKVIRPDRAHHAGAQQRFLNEARITGQLEHPGIVPIYELVAQADGQPAAYAMRFIKGRTLAEAIRAFHQESGRQGKNSASQAKESTAAGEITRLTGTLWGEPPVPASSSPVPLGFDSLAFRELLNVFISVCQAVAYAHSRGVIHRDLKPQNVVLGDFGEVIVLDWGLAKIAMESTREGNGELGKEDRAGSGLQHEGPQVGPSAAESDPWALTRAGQILGTPAYMSPEQAAGRVDQITHQSDIYSLGVMLYELLAGRLPFLAGSADEALRQVREEIPPPIRELQASVPPALDHVCRTAMARRPEDRYASAQELARDLERYLADEPVSVYPDPWTRRLRRWMKRHRTLVTSAAAVLIVALVSLVIAAVLLKQANDDLLAANDREQVARGTAEQNFQMALAAVDRYLTRVSESEELKSADLQPLRENLLRTAREFYDRFVQTHGNDPVLQLEQGRARGRLAMITRITGPKADAQQFAEEAIAILQRLVDENPGEPRYRQELANGHGELGRVYRDMGRIAEAETAHRSALALHERLAGEHPKVLEYQQSLADSYNNLATLAMQIRQPERAKTPLEQAVQISRRLHEENPQSLPLLRAHALYTTHHGLLLQYLRELDRVQEVHLRALELRQRLVAAAPHVGEYQSDLANSHHILGLWFAAIGENGKAELHYREALGLRGKLVHTPRMLDQSTRLGTSARELAHFLNDQRHWSKALPLYDQAVTILEGVLEKEPQQALAREALHDTCLGRGYTLNRLERPADARKDWDYADRLGWRQGDPILRRGRSQTLALLGEHAAAAQEADRLASESGDRTIHDYELACAYALAAAALLKHPNPTEADQQLVQEYGGKAMKRLHRLANENALDTVWLAKDPYLKSLRQRADFQRLLTAPAKIR